LSDINAIVTSDNELLPEGSQVKFDYENCAKWWKEEYASLWVDHNPPENLEKTYLGNWGITRADLNLEWLQDVPKTSNILEVGAGEGSQLKLLAKQGWIHSVGYDIGNLTDVQGDAASLPFRDDSFDLVFTSGMMIHIPPNLLKDVSREIIRVSRKWYGGFELEGNTPNAFWPVKRSGPMWANQWIEVFRTVSPLDWVRYSRILPLIESNKSPAHLYLLEKN